MGLGRRVSAFVHLTRTRPATRLPVYTGHEQPRHRRAAPSTSTREACVSPQVRVRCQSLYCRGERGVAPPAAPPFSRIRRAARVRLGPSEAARCLPRRLGLRVGGIQPRLGPRMHPPGVARAVRLLLPRARLGLQPTLVRAMFRRACGAQCAQRERAAAPRGVCSRAARVRPARSPYGRRVKSHCSCAMPLTRVPPPRLHAGVPEHFDDQRRLRSATKARAQGVNPGFRVVGPRPAPASVALSVAASLFKQNLSAPTAAAQSRRLPALRLGSLGAGSTVSAHPVDARVS